MLFILMAACGSVNNHESTSASPSSIASTSTPAVTSTSAPDLNATLLSTSTDILPSIADAVAAVYPSVVTINTEATTYSLFYGKQVEQGAGSGWIYRQDGIIVTNNHVIEGADKVTVGLADGRAFEAKAVYGDPVSDLAIVKIDVSGLPVARVGDSTKLRVGDWMVAIGNPLGQGLRAKQGIISGLNISLSAGDGETLYNLIETSAAINPGNSGGPLADMSGEVIGITSAKIAAVGVEGMGYAISTETAIPTIGQLIDKGYISRPWLGAQYKTVDPLVAMLNRLSVNTGVVISEVTAGSPADKAGLKILDVIIEYNGEAVTSAGGLDQAILSGQIGQTVKITYVEGRNKKTTTATLAESPGP